MQCWINFSFETYARWHQTYVKLHKATINHWLIVTADRMNKLGMKWMKLTSHRRAPSCLLSWNWDHLLDARHSHTWQRRSFSSLAMQQCNHAESMLVWWPIYLFIYFIELSQEIYYRNFKQMFIRLQFCVKEKTQKDQLDSANTKPIHL